MLRMSYPISTPITRYGFTLIELLVVMFILGISTSLIAPSFFNWLAKIEFNNEIKYVAAKLSLYKEKSFFAGENYLVKFSPGVIYIVDSDEYHSLRLEDGEMTLCPEALPSKELDEPEQQFTLNESSGTDLNDLSLRKVAIVKQLIVSKEIR